MLVLKSALEKNLVILRIYIILYEIDKRYAEIRLMTNKVEWN